MDTATPDIDNPPAFPFVEPPTSCNVSCGMTLRDWFAGTLAPDSRAMDALSDADDQDLLQRFGTPEEIEEGFRYAAPGSPVSGRSIELRASLEARGRAALRFLEANAMLKARGEIPTA